MVLRRQISDVERFCTVLLEHTERSYSCPRGRLVRQTRRPDLPVGTPDSHPDDVRVALPIMATSPSPQPAAFDQGPLRINRLHLLTGGHRIRNRLLISAG